MTKPCRILVVDDDDDLREALGDALADTGHVVTLAANGAQAMSTLQATPDLPGLIILDLMMPVMDGVEFRSVQLANSRLVDIPVLLLSADSTLKEKANEMRVSAHCAKPVDLRKLYALVERWCAYSDRSPSA